MVTTRKRSSSSSSQTLQNHEGKRSKNSNASVENQEAASSFTSSAAAVVAAKYEELRAQRMKDNVERMKNLGILDLSKKLKEKTAAASTAKKRKKPNASASADGLPVSNDPPRRSSRLKNMTQVSYSECRSPKKEKVMKFEEIHLEEGSIPEVYTEEHEKVLGDSKAAWTLFVDGYNEQGQRIYDPYEGKSCHQCRQKTLGCRTKCSNCKLVQGQLCGDCLYMRYGENLVEVNEDADWICPVCRGICNCSRCRRQKGWAPTGAIYRQVHGLGFKSVAHYLIHTRSLKTKIKEQALKNLVSAEFQQQPGEKAESIDAIPVLETNGNRQVDTEDGYMEEDNYDDSVDDKRGEY